MGTREIVEAMYEALSVGDWKGFTGMLGDEVVLSEPPFLPYGGIYRGASGLKRIAPQIGAALDMATLRIQRVVVEGDHAFAVLSVEVVTSGERLVVAEEVTVQDNKVTEWTVYVHDAATLLSRTPST